MKNYNILKFFLFVFLSSVIFLSATSCAKDNAILLEDSSSNPTRLFFWRIQSQVSKVYILGSLPVGMEDLFPLSETIDVAFDASDYLVVEFDPYNIDEKQLKDLLHYSNGDSLSRHISRNTYLRLINAFRSFGIGPEKLSTLKPSAVVSSLVISKLTEMGYNPDFDIDQYYLDLAHGNKNIIELENIKQRLNLMNDMGEDYINYSLGDISRWNNNMDILKTAWQTGDSVSMQNYYNKCAKAYPGLETFVNIFIIERNKQMCAKIEEFLKREGRYFVIVGTEHLIGKNGIINTLKNTNKYKINQLFN